jgi:glycosyltransferase involved in cell wall biosynthesis
VQHSLPPAIRARTRVVRYGIDTAAIRARAERSAARAALGVGDDEIVIGTVANLVAKKDYPTLLGAAARALADDRTRRVRYVAVGQGPLEDDIRERHAALDLGDRFQLLGYRPDAVRVMSAFDIFTLASQHEGLPVALMDALALGLPVVVTSVGGVPQAVTDGQEGLLVPAGSPERLAAAHLTLAGDAALRRRCSAAARTRSAVFDIGRAAHRLGDIYEAVAGARKPARHSSAE